MRTYVFTRRSIVEEIFTVKAISEESALEMVQEGTVKLNKASGATGTTVAMSSSLSAMSWWTF